MKKVGLIGCGFMGGMHYSCYKEIPNAEVVAVADLREEKAKELTAGDNVKITTDAISLINDPSIDVIDICLPTYLHCEYAVKAMKSGKDVFIEKPVCLTNEEAEILLRTEKETGSKVQVGQVIRFWGEYVWLKNAALSGTYGKIKSAYFGRVSPRPDWSYNGWYNDPDLGGTAALDLHIHDTDFVRYLMGEPNEKFSCAGRNSDGVLEHIYTLFKYDDASVSVEGGWGYPEKFPFLMSFRVIFEKATVAYDTNGFNVYCENGDVIKPEISYGVSSEGKAGGNISSLGGYYEELKYYIDCLENKKSPDRATLSEASKSLALVLSEIEAAGGKKI